MESIVVYLDVVFLVNFTMNFALLVIADGFLKNSTTYLRIAIAAAIGAAWACIVEMRLVQDIVIRTLCTYIFISLIMTRIYIGRCSLKKLIKSALILIALAASIGGLVQSIYWHTGIGYVIRSAFIADTVLLVCLMAAVAAMAVLVRRLLIQRTYVSKCCNADITFYMCHVTVTAMIDTGNVLMDSIYKKPVHIIDKDVLNTCADNIFEGDTALCTRLRLHYVPYSSLGNAQGCIAVIMADRMEIHYGKKHLILENVPVGISRNRLSLDGAFQMLINSQVLD